MGNSRSRPRGLSRRLMPSSSSSGVGSGPSEVVDTDIQRLAELLFLRQELEQRQEALRTSLERRRNTDSDGAGPEDTTGEGGARSRSRSPPEQETTGQSSFLRRLIRHHLLLEYIDRTGDFLLNDDEDNNNDSDAADTASIDSRSSSIDTYEGIPELFQIDELSREQRNDEEETNQRAIKIKSFQEKVLQMLQSQKDEIEKKIDSAMDVQVTLKDLLRDQVDAQKCQDESRYSFIQNLVSDIHKSEDFLDPSKIGSLGKNLDEIGQHLTTLKDLTSVRGEDEVMCTVCLSCPHGVIWDCVKCDHLVCDVCRRRITACPTCRVRFRAKAPRRNRWAEKLARIQREKTTFDE